MSSAGGGGTLKINGETVSEFIVFLDNNQVTKYAKLDASNDALGLTVDGKSITFKTAEAVTAAICTTEGQSLVIEAPKAEVYHYGKAKSVVIKSGTAKAAETTGTYYHGNSETESLTVNEGHMELTKSIKSVSIEAEGPVKVDVTEDAKVSSMTAASTGTNTVSVSVAEKASVESVGANTAMSIEGAGAVSSIVAEKPVTIAVKVDNLEVTSNDATVTLNKGAAVSEVVVGEDVTEAPDVKTTDASVVAPSIDNSKNTSITVVIKDSAGAEITVHIHSYQTVDEKAATCTEEGYLKQKCSAADCNKEKTTVIKGKHTVQNVKYLSGDCEKGGYVEQKCTKCDWTGKKWFSSGQHSYHNNVCLNCGNLKYTTAIESQYKRAMMSLAYLNILYSEKESPLGLETTLYGTIANDLDGAKIKIVSYDEDTNYVATMKMEFTDKGKDCVTLEITSDTSSTGQCITKLVIDGKNVSLTKAQGQNLYNYSASLVPILNDFAPNIGKWYGNATHHWIISSDGLAMVGEPHEKESGCRCGDARVPNEHKHDWVQSGTATYLTKGSYYKECFYCGTKTDEVSGVCKELLGEWVSTEMCSIDVGDIEAYLALSFNDKGEVAAGMSPKDKASAVGDLSAYCRYTTGTSGDTLTAMDVTIPTKLPTIALPVETLIQGAWKYEYLVTDEEEGKQTTHTYTVVNIFDGRTVTVTTIIYIDAQFAYVVSGKYSIESDSSHAVTLKVNVNGEDTSSNINFREDATVMNLCDRKEISYLSHL